MRCHGRHHRGLRAPQLPGGERGDEQGHRRQCALWRVLTHLVRFSDHHRRTGCDRGRRTLDAARGTGRRERVDSRCMQRESRRDTRDVSRARGWHGMRGDERACMRIACEMREVFSARYRYSSGRVIWGTWTREACVFAQRAASIAAESRCASLSSGLIMEHGEAVESLNMRHAALTASYT